MSGSFVRAAVFASCTALVALAAAAQMQPGKYHKTITMAGEKPMAGDECVTQKDIDAGLTRMGMESGTGCKVQDMKNSGGRLSYRMTCDSAGVATVIETAGTIGRDNFDLNVSIRTGKETKPETLRVVGKRVGNCK